MQGNHFRKNLPENHHKPDLFKNQLDGRSVLIGMLLAHLPEQVVETIDYRKVLVVDDDKLLGYIIQAILEGEGYEVRTASDGEEGYSTCLHFRPDIVVADIWMPRKNGLEMMEQIRTQRPEIKTIYISGELNQARLQLDEERKKFRVSVLKKPFSREELARLIFEVSRGAPAQDYQRERRKHG